LMGLSDAGEREQRDRKREGTTKMKGGHGE
jgi:hypothetical protein